ALQTAFDHVVDGIAAGPPDTEYGDARLEFGQIRNSEVYGHGAVPFLHRLYSLASGASPRRATRALQIKMRPVASRRPWRNSRCRCARSAARSDGTACRRRDPSAARGLSQ